MKLTRNPAKLLSMLHLAMVTSVICAPARIGLMLLIMAIKLTCPVCTSASLQPILRDVHFSARVGSFMHELSDFLAFSCVEGHVFLVMSDQGHVVESERGFSLVV